MYRESFYTRKLLHTEKSLHRRAFTQGSFHTQREAFTQRRLTQRNFYTQKLLHTKAFTQRSLCTEAPLHEVTNWNWQQFFRKNPSQELSGTHLLPKKLSLYIYIYFNQICSKKTYPHSIAFNPTLRWNGGSSNPAEPTMSVSSKIRPRRLHTSALTNAPRASQSD